MRIGRSDLCLVARRRQATDLLASGRGARPQGVYLAVQAGQALTLVGGCTQEPGDSALLGCVRRLRLVALGDDGVERLRRLGDPGVELLVLLLRPAGLGLELLGIAADTAVFGLDG